MNNRPLINANRTQRGLVFLVTSLLGLGALNAKAEQIDDQLLVSGTQIPGPGATFVQGVSFGVSARFGLFKEWSRTSLSYNTKGVHGVVTISITGHGVMEFPSGDSIFYRFNGTVTTSTTGGKPVDLIATQAAQVAICQVTIESGTGVFAGVWGDGEMTWLTNSSNQFTSMLDLTLEVPFPGRGGR
jgi:hypothetical protein